MTKITGIDAIKSNASKVASRICRDDKGQLSLTFALAAIPFMMAATLAFDMSNMNHMKSALQNAADAAALAAANAMATGHDDEDKTAIANKMFYYNVTDELRADMTAKPTTVIDYSTGTVNVSVKVNVKERFSRMFADSMKLDVKSQAKVDPGNPICLMALNRSNPDSLRITGTADVQAADCAVQVNSRDAAAMSQSGSSKIAGEAFCVAGSYTGSNYAPMPKTGCAQEEDPLMTQFMKDLAATDTTTCQTLVNNKQQLTEKNLASGVLNPGVYCGGLNFKQGTFSLTPGVYVIRDGEFYVAAGATVNGLVGVTLLLVGDQTTRIDTQGGANLNIYAPSSGKFSGIAIAQDPASVPTPQVNTITGGGDMNINGIVYFPAQPLLITGNGVIGQDVDQFAVMADTIEVKGNGLLEIKVGADYKAAGLPQLPEANEVVRLSR